MSLFERLKRFLAALRGDEPRNLLIERLPPAAIVHQPAALAFSPGEEVTPRISSGRSTRARIHRVFNAASPVEDRFGLSGRAAEIDRLTAAVIEHLKHAIVFGARGSGKTSLVRVFGDLADEAGHVVLYESTSGDLPFTDLFRPFLAHLPGAEAPGWFGTAARNLAATEFSVRDLANLLLDVRRPTVLVLDEFDRIERADTKTEIAALMKMLSDTHASVQIVMVGIAGNVDDLIGGHPSLRRHMTTIAVGPILKADLAELVASCAERAGMMMTEAALSMIAEAALGSPYHARLFGLEAALAAYTRGASEIGVRDAEAGFGAALADWAEVSEDSYDLFDRLLASGSNQWGLLRVATRSARMLVEGDRDAGQSSISSPPEAERGPAMASALEQLAPALKTHTEKGGFMFRDSLAPQFLVLMIIYGIRLAQRLGA